MLLKSYVVLFVTHFLGFARSQADVCYPEVGCFSKGQGPLSHLNSLPSDPKEITTEFVLWSRHANESAVVSSLAIEADMALVDFFDPSLPLIVIVHGFGDNGYADWVLTMIQRFLVRMDANVVAVHWPKGAESSNYFRAARNTELIGRQTGNFLEVAMRMGITPDMIHLVGHSLGSQISNFAVHWLRQVSEVAPGFTPGRISGLDPASPFFCDGDYGPDTFLEATDANFVDVYHSNQGSILFGHVGCEGVYGHVDFYPNGGYDQPGCPNPIIGAIEDLFTGESLYAACSHFRAVHIFSESLVADDEYFRGFPCLGLDDFDNDFIAGDCFECEPSADYARGCGKAGIDAHLHGNGSFYFPTRFDDPADGVDVLGGRMIRLSVESSFIQALITWGQFIITIKDPVKGNLGPFPVTNIDTPISNGERKRKVVLTDTSFTPGLPEMVVDLKYVAFDGFFDGQYEWLVDIVIVEDDLENRYYGCGSRQHFESGVARELLLLWSDEPLC